MISLISALMNSINSTIGTNKEVPLDTMINETNKKVSDLKTRLDNTSSEINEIKTIISGVENIDNDIICDFRRSDQGDFFQKNGFVNKQYDNRNYYEKEIIYVAKDDGIIIFDSGVIGDLKAYYSINNSNNNYFIFDNSGGDSHNEFFNRKESLNISKDDVIKIKLQANSNLNISTFIIRTLYNTKNTSLLSKSIKRVSYGSSFFSSNQYNTFYHHNVDVDKSLIILNGSCIYNNYNSNDDITYQPILVARTNNSFIINNTMYGYFKSSRNIGVIDGCALSWQLIEFY